MVDRPTGSSIVSSSAASTRGKAYKVTDYVNQKDYGTVTGPTAKLNVDFTGNLLLEAAPAQ